MCEQTRSEKRRKKKKRKRVKEGVVCLDCFKVYCAGHAQAHTADVPIAINTKTRSVYCGECKVDLRKLVKDVKVDPVEELVTEIVDKIAKELGGEEARADYNAELKEFLSHINSAFPSKQDTDEETATEAPPDLSTNKVFVQTSDAPPILPYQVKGLRNLGNTCYFNSAVQCINISSALVDAVLRQRLIPSQDIDKAAPLTIRRNLHDFFVAMRGEGNRCNPIDLLNAVRKRYPKFNGYHQQDSHELLTALLDGLIEEEQNLYKSLNEGKNLSFYDTTVSRVCSSKLANKVTCKTCDSVYWVFDPSVAYSLPISCGSKEVVFKYKKSKNKNQSRNRNKKKKRAREELEMIEEVKDIKEVKAKDILGAVESKREEKYLRVTINDKQYLEPEKPPMDFDSDEQLATLNDCLDFFFHKEVLCAENGNSFYCTKCLGSFSLIIESTEEPQIAIREYYILEPPKVLILNLKRFMINEHYARKNSRHVEIPFEISLDKYLLLACDTEKTKELESIEKLSSDSTLKLASYSLYGIVSHSGEINGGHYIAFVKTEDT